MEMQSIVIHYHKYLSLFGDGPELSVVIRPNSFEINIFSPREIFCKEDAFKTHMLTVDELQEFVNALNDVLGLELTMRPDRED